MQNEQSNFQTPQLQYKQSELYVAFDKPLTQSQGITEPACVPAGSENTQAGLNELLIPMMATPKDLISTPHEPPEPKLTVLTNPSSSDERVLQAYYAYGRRRSITCVGSSQAAMVISICILVAFLLLFLVAGFLK